MATSIKGKFGRALVVQLVLVVGLWMLPGAEAAKKDVPYVPTPQPVVDRMLEMAQVGPEDFVFDLGCGDGRIVVSAARDRGARGVGIDIDPRRIEESNANAQRDRVTDRVEFRIQDLFETDFSQATVLTLYLLPSVNIELRPKILRELRPGTRVVSHDFDMGEWEPDQSEMMDYSAIFFWVVPANVSGTWTLTDGEEEFRVILEQEFQHVRGSVRSGDQDLPLREVVLNGDRIAFTMDRLIDGRLTPVTYRGRADGLRLTGEFEPGGTTWNGVREPGTARPLDAHAIENPGVEALTEIRTI